MIDYGFDIANSICMFVFILELFVISWLHSTIHIIHIDSSDEHSHSNYNNYNQSNYKQNNCCNTYYYYIINKLRYFNKCYYYLFPFKIQLKGLFL